MVREKGIKKKGFILLAPQVWIGIFVVVAVIAIYVGKYALGISKSFKSDMVVSEVSAWSDDVSTFKDKGTNSGDGYISAKDGTKLNAENLWVWTKSKPKLVGTGASSYFCSSTPHGCKIKYYFSTGTDDEYWSVFIDASEALATMDTKEKEALEIQIIKNYKGSGYNPIVDHSATTVSSSTTAVVASGANDGDGVFEIGNL